MKWIISYINARGEEDTMAVAGTTRAEAIKAAGINHNRVLDTKRDWLTNIKKTLFDVRLNFFKQSTLMSTLSATAISGQNPNIVFERFLQEDRHLRKLKAEILQIDRVSDQLRRLNFDDQAVVLVETGETTGDMGQALRRASRELNDRRRLTGKLKSALIMPTIICVLSMSAMIGMPIYFVPLLDTFQSSGLDIEFTFATRLMQQISIVCTTFWPFIVSGIVLSIWQRKQIWPYLSKVMPFDGLDEYFKSIRALSFLTMFYPLYERGVEIERVLDIQAMNAKGTSRKIYEYMLDETRAGTAFSVTLKQEHWPSLLVQGLHGFEEAVPNAKDEMLSASKEMLADRTQMLGERISGLLMTIGIMMGAATAIMLALGIYYPIFSASPG